MQKIISKTNFIFLNFFFTVVVVSGIVSCQGPGNNENKAPLSGFAFVGTVVEKANPTNKITTCKWSGANGSGETFPPTAVDNNAAVNLYMDSAKVPYKIIVNPNNTSLYRPRGFEYHGGLTTPLNLYKFYLSPFVAPGGADSLCITLLTKDTQVPTTSTLKIIDMSSSGATLYESGTSAVNGITKRATVGHQYKVTGSFIPTYYVTIPANGTRYTYESYCFIPTYQ